MPISARRPRRYQQRYTFAISTSKMHTMVEHESFDGDRYGDMPETVAELLMAAAEDEVEAVTMHELGRCHELEGPCIYCAGQVRH